MRRPVRAAAAIGASVLLVVPLVLQGAAVAAVSGAAATCDNYTAQAAADGTRVGFAADNLLPLTNATSAEGPAAYALVTSGASGGHAAAPYPGDAALSALGLVGNGVDSSLYPASAQSQYPTRPHAAVSNPGLTLTSDSTETRTKAVAVAGGSAPAGAGNDAGASKSTATGECSPVAGITADADTDTEALSFSGGTLRIGRVHSAAHSVIGLDGKAKISADLQLGQVTVAGQTVQISDNGLSAAGQVIPLPNPAGDVLKGQGITLSYVAPVKDRDGRGITAAGLVVSAVLPLNSVGQGTSPSTVTYTFGRAYARSEGGLSGAAAPTSFSGSTGFGVGTPAAPTSPATSGGSDAGVSVPTPATAPALGGPDPAAPAPAVAGAAPPAAAGGPLNNAGFRFPATDWVSVYLALVLGGAVLLGGGFFVRRLVERQQWI